MRALRMRGLNTFSHYDCGLFQVKQRSSATLHPSSHHTVRRWVWWSIQLSTLSFLARG